MTSPSLSALSADRRRGFIITAIGGLSLSVDVPLLRLAHGDVWSVIAVRSVTTFIIGFLLWLAVRRFTSARPPFIGSGAAWLAGLCYGLTSVAFITAVFNTSTANVVFILAFTPMFAALLSWIFLRERPSPSTFVTMGVMLCGVALIVGGGLSQGHMFGDLLAVLTALLVASAITIGRATREDMGFTPLAATALPAIIGLVMAAPAGITIAQPQWVLLDGAIMIPLAYWCLATGPRYLTGPEVGMFYLLETILAPIWVWMVFSEVPTAPTLAGGFILISALIGYSLWQARRQNALA